MYHGVLPWANNSKRLSSCQCLRLERHDRDRELRGPGEIITKGNVAHLQGWTNGLFRPFNAPRGSHRGEEENSFPSGVLSLSCFPCWFPNIRRN
jgi:hypothetical protein